MSSTPIDLPASLHVATPAEGQALAWRLARGLMAALPVHDSMADHLRTSAGCPTPEVVAAIYFHAITLANAGWTGSGSSSV